MHINTASPPENRDPGRRKEIADIMSAVEKLPDIREAKVREIRESIDSGVYAVNPRKVAESILKNL
jgi:flagellar biosynthesis anti-sigma factor FlgM